MVMVGGPRLASVDLRAAGAGDEAFLFEVYAASRREPLAPLGWDRATVDAFLRTQYDAEQRDWRHHAGAEGHVIVCDGEPVGRFFVARGDHELRIMDITLLPDWRGQGIGSALLGELLDEARRSGRTVRTQVESSSPAVRLFRRLGFLEAAARGTTLLMEWTPRASG